MYCLITVGEKRVALVRSLSKKAISRTAVEKTASLLNLLTKGKPSSKLNTVDCEHLPLNKL